MIKRIVRLDLQAEQIDSFRQLFEYTKHAIRQFEGCQHLELLQSIDSPNVLFTYSFWESEEALEAYRHSALFKSTWQQTRLMFAGKAIAWSVRMLDLVSPLDDNP